MRSHSSLMKLVYLKKLSRKLLSTSRVSMNQRGFYQEQKARLRREQDQIQQRICKMHVTANMVLSLAQRFRKIFESSEVDEKRQLLNFVFQNLELKDKKLSVTLREPFKIIKDTSLFEKCPGMCHVTDTNYQGNRCCRSTSHHQVP